MSLSIIAAMDRNRLIGKDNRMPWYIAEDLAYFRSKTLGHSVIMGKNTWHSLGSLLDERTNIVLTRDKEFSYPGLLVCHSLAEVLEYCSEDENFIIGGASIFEQFVPLVSKLYITKIEAEFEGDRYFPELDMQAWEQVFFEQKATKSGYQISFNEFILKS